MSMKHSFQFDKKTGTMVKTDEPPVREIKPNVCDEVQVTKSGECVQKPVFTEEKQIEVKGNAVNIQQDLIVKMQRVDKPTLVQLVDNNGLPESYIDSISTGVMMFREQQDYDICQIVDEKTGKVLAYIGGYALQINFNMSELRSMDRIEQCLQGLVKLFRHKIMSQTFDKSAPKD